MRSSGKSHRDAMDSPSLGGVTGPGKEDKEEDGDMHICMGLN